MSIFLDNITNKDGLLIPDEIAKQFHVPIDDIAHLTGLNKTSLKSDILYQSNTIQSQLRKMVAVINHVLPWSDNCQQAYNWYRKEPIPSLGNITAMELVKQGKYNAVTKYLERIEKGGFS